MRPIVPVYLISERRHPLAKLVRSSDVAAPCRIPAAKSHRQQEPLLALNEHIGTRARFVKY